MQVIGTPRPSASRIGETEDNGFFERFEPSSSSEFEKGINLDKDGDDLLVETDGGKRDSRTRSQSFHEMYDEKAETPPIVLAGSQTLLVRQLNIVTNLSALCYTEKAWGGPSPEECAEEEMLEKEEQAAVEKWKGIGGKGKADPSEFNSPKKSMKKNRNNSLSSALVPSSGNLVIDGNNTDLLPRYEDKVVILALNPTTTSPAPRVEWKTSDLNDAGGRRVHCQVWDYHPSQNPDSEDALIDMYIKTSDALVVLCSYSEWSGKCIARAIQLDRVVVVTNEYGSSPNDARRNSIKLGAHFDQKGNAWMEIAARDVTLRSARLRGEKKNVIVTMEKQLKKTEKSSGKGSSPSCHIV